MKTKKQSIPKTMRILVWNAHIGEEIGKAKCLCCKLTDITQMKFHVGHIIAEKYGGKLEVKNLKPICGSCNSSMGTRNMNDFIKLLNIPNKNKNIEKNIKKNIKKPIKKENSIICKIKKFFN